MSEAVFHRHVWLMKNLGVGGGKLWRFGAVQLVVWLNAACLWPAVGGDSPLAIRCMGLAFSLVTCGSGFKLTQLRKHADDLGTLLEELSGDDKTTSMIITVRKVSRVYVSFLLGILCAWLSFPWLRGEPVLPLDFWTPFSLDSFFPFCAFYAFASLGLVCIAYTQEAVDTLLLMLAAFICRRLEQIKELLTEIGEPDEQRVHSKGRADEEVLKWALTEHVHTIRLIRKFDKLINDIFLVQVLQTTIVSTACFYSASKVKELKEIPKFLIVSSVTFLQFFIYCWLGEEISEHSNNLHRAVYQNRWYEGNLRIKKSINIYETFTKNHFKLKGGRMFVIHLQTYLQMIRESFSAFMVLRAVAKAD